MLPGIFDKNGKLHRWPVPRKLPKQDVSRVVLHLTYRDKGQGSAIDVMSSLQANSRSLGRVVRARTGCKSSGWKGQATVEPHSWLGCWLECDKGGFTVERVPATADVDLRFVNLSIPNNCTGKAHLELGTFEVEKPELPKFRLSPVPMQLCSRLRMRANQLGRT